MLGVFVSFMASLAHSASVAAQQTLLAAVDDATLLSWCGTGVAVMAAVSPALMRLYKSFRETKLSQDTAEMDAWGQQIADANKAKGTAEGKLEVALAQIEELKQRLAAVTELSLKQDDEIRANRHKVRNLEQELLVHKQVAAKTQQMAKQAGRVAADSKAQVQDQAHRIEHLERATGSGDNIPTTP